MKKCKQYLTCISKVLIQNFGIHLGVYYNLEKGEILMNLKKKFVELLCMVSILVMTISILNIQNVSAATIARLNISSKIITEGESFNLKVIGSKSTPSWKTSDKSIAKVSKSGKVTAIKKGEAVITCTVNNKKLTCNVFVEPYIENKPDITLEYYTEFDGYTSLILIELRNNGTKNLKIMSEAMIWDESDDTYATLFYLFDSKSPDYEFIDDIKLKSGKTMNLWYRGDDYYFYNNTIIAIEFKYDGYMYYGYIDSDRNFYYVLQDQ